MNYNSAKWERLRKAIMRRDGYLCQYNAQYGKKVEAEVVHHIFPAEIFPEYRYCAWNLVSLSRAAHNMMHDRDYDTLSEEGLKWLRRTARKRKMREWENFRGNGTRGSRRLLDGTCAETQTDTR